MKTTPMTARPMWMNTWLDYWRDSVQRGVLFAEILLNRESQGAKHRAEAVPNVLRFDAEPFMRGKDLARPVNYLIARIVPPAGTKIDPCKRPFVIIDPRAGHGPGIGGFKADSEIGFAMQAGHPCYIIGFTPDPEPGQTIEDVLYAEIDFLEAVKNAHPDADGRPCVIGNCQGGWAAMMLAAVRPDLCGPLIIAGSPLSYWAGVEGKNPMRYTGGLLGGSWLTAMAGDLGRGIFNGGYLVQNFENLNPANTLWTKYHNLWSGIDSEADRFLEFEQWWGSHINLNQEEIQWIVDQLFIGNRLSTGQLVTRDGNSIDFRNITSPVICFCSSGDNITPPQQALGWITDLYESDEEILAFGQTILYRVHDNVGHLGIFVSSDVARKEHRELASNIEFIDVLPPGIYEVVLTPRRKGEAGFKTDAPDWIMAIERRTLADIRQIVQPSEKNERRFEAVRRVSEINLAAYKKYTSPWVRWLTSLLPYGDKAPWAILNPLSPQSPCFKGMAQWMTAWANQVRDHRLPAQKTNTLQAYEGPR